MSDNRKFNELQNNEYCQEHIHNESDIHDEQLDVKDGRCDKKDQSNDLIEQREEIKFTDDSREDDTNDRQVAEPNVKYNMKKLSDIFGGTHETQVSEEGEADLHKRLVGCMKNPGHNNFVSVNDFNINHLPEGYHDNLLVEYIKATADLTVRVAVTMTSTERPEFWPNTKEPYAFYNMRENGVMRLGTGMVRHEIIKYNWGTCPCHKCEHSNTHSTVWGEVWMYTARHVVFDDLEAKHTTCRLFYEGQDSPLVTLDGWTVEWANIEEDRCVLKCVICDVALLDKLDKMVRYWADLWDIVYNKYKKYGDKLTLIVSHPHGCPKQISLGHLIDRYEVSDGITKYTYTTCTCPGSSGAQVHPLGYDVGSWYFLHVHSGVNTEGRNYSSTGRDYSYYR